MAPEALQAMREEQLEMDFESAVDVYSFAIVMWEMLTHCEPWADEFTPKELNLLVDAVLQGRRPHVRRTDEGGAPNGFTDLMRECWAQDPSERPTFEDILQRLS